MSDNRAVEVMKRKRKIRKQLRQIEHLKLLLRPLNEEEEDKMWREETLREELAKLNDECDDNDYEQDADESGDEAHARQHTKSGAKSSPTTNTSAHSCEQSPVLHRVATPLQLQQLHTHDSENEASADEQAKNSSAPTEDIVDVEQLNVKADNENENDETEKVAAEETSSTTQVVEQLPPPASTAIPSESKNKKQKAKAKKSIESVAKQPVAAPAPTPVQTPPPPPPPVMKPPKPSILIDTRDIPQAHEDLIVSVDVDVEHGLIVTGR